jgi:transcriptional regulator with XRE-family HTH domain
MDKLNLAAIRRELGVGGAGTNHDANADLGEMGQRLRATRTALGMSLAEVARHSGLSISFLSAVERGQSSISVGNLFKLADAYGTTVPALGATQPGSERNVLHRHERARYSAGGGRVLIEDLIASPGALEAQHMEILPGGGSEEAYAHPGEEMIYILSGTLSFVIEERDVYQLVPGDTLYFQSTQLHRWSNDGEELVSLIWINVPLVQQTNPGRRQHGASRRPGKTTHLERTVPGTRRVDR